MLLILSFKVGWSLCLVTASGFYRCVGPRFSFFSVSCDRCICDRYTCDRYSAYRYICARFSFYRYIFYRYICDRYIWICEGSPAPFVRNVSTTCMRNLDGCLLYLRHHQQANVRFFSRFLKLTLVAAGLLTQPADNFARAGGRRKTFLHRGERRRCFHVQDSGELEK